MRQGIAEAFVLGEGLLGSAREGLKAQERGVRLLEGGLLHRGPPQGLDGQAVLVALFVEPRETEEQGEEELAQLLAPTLYPLVVAVIG